MRLILALAAVLTFAVADAQAFGKRNKGCSSGCGVSTSTVYYTPTVVHSGVKTCSGTSCGIVTNAHQHTPVQSVFQGKYIISNKEGCSNGSCKVK